LEDLLVWAVEFFPGTKKGWDVTNISDREGIDIFDPGSE